MKIIEQDEFNALDIIKGIRQCPGNRDYSRIKKFVEPCKFGDWCRFGLI